MLCSIELWVRFAWYGILTLCKGSAPLSILERETLARELFRGHVKSSGKIEVGAFVASEKNDFGISLDRWSCAPERLFKALAYAAARRRAQPFKGFALFEAASLKSVRVKDLPPIGAIPAPTRANPFHADVLIPPHREKSFYLLVATEIRDKTKATALLYK